MKRPQHTQLLLNLLQQKLQQKLRLPRPNLHRPLQKTPHQSHRLPRLNLHRLLTKSRLLRLSIVRDGGSNYWRMCCPYDSGIFYLSM